MLVFEVNKEEAKSLNEECHELNSDDLFIVEKNLDIKSPSPRSMKVECNTKSFNTKLFQGKKCQDQHIYELNAEWNKCTKINEQKYVMVTGANWMGLTVVSALFAVLTA